MVARPDFDALLPSAQAQAPEQVVPPLDLLPGALAETVADMPDRPKIAWRVTPESLGLCDNLTFDVGTTGQEGGTTLLGDLVVTR